MDKILIADDDYCIRFTLKEYLPNTFPDFQLEVFESGKTLVERLNADLTGVRMALIDNNMPPGMTGVEIIERYAKTVEFPFILNYAGDREIGERAVKNGAFGYLSKPVKLMLVKEMMKRALAAS